MKDTDTPNSLQAFLSPAGNSFKNICRAIYQALPDDVAEQTGALGFSVKYFPETDSLTFNVELEGKNSNGK